jgi:acetyltransferase
MGQYHLDRIFQPDSIAVVGASEKQGSIGNAVMTNLIAGRFAGKVFPVNTRYQKVHGLPCCPSVKEVAAAVDLAVIATPIETVPEVIADCVARGLGGAIVISAGGKEAGPAGQAIEKEIRELAYRGGLRILGPNCLGVMRPGACLNASFASAMPADGNLGFISQSGAICTAVLDLAFRERFGFSHFVSIGSMLDIDFGDMIDYLGSDPKTKSILLYIEHLTQYRKFMSAARAVSRIKPIIALKAGRSEAGARAAASHTGALAGEDAVYDAAFQRAGIVRVDTIGELFDCAELTAKQPRPTGPRLAIISNGGGPAVMAVDTLARLGREPAVLEEETRRKLDAFLPRFWSRGNPIDILGDASPERFRQTMEICFAAREIDAMLVILAPQALTDPLPVADALVDAMTGHRFPVFTCWMGGRSIAGAVDKLNAAGIPTYETPERAVRAFLYMYEYAENTEAARQVPPRINRHLDLDRESVRSCVASAPRDRFMSEGDAATILSAYGFPVTATRFADSEDQAVAMAEKLGFPLVMKLHSPDITHKTDAGGVRLDLRSREDVLKAYRGIVEAAGQYDSKAHIAGVSLQPYHASPDYEILLGAKRDPNFGPVLLFGMGGIFTEILKDRAIGLPPMNRLLARRLMQKTKAFSLLQGYRNRKPADLEQLEEMLMRLSQLLIDVPEIAELDMNPVLIKDGRARVVDARILLSEHAARDYRHLVISPYPQEYEHQETAKDGSSLFVRPVKPEDAPLFRELFAVLSPTSIYYRFFTPVKELSPAMLARFTQIDYDREIALVAVDRDKEAERIVGVARIIGDPDGKTGEFAVLVGDPWHGRGIGAALLQKCLDIAREKGFEKITGSVLQQNKNMLALAKKLGFKVRPQSEYGERELTLDLVA